MKKLIFLVIGLILGLFFRNILFILDNIFCEKVLNELTPPDIPSKKFCISNKFGFGSSLQLPAFIFWLIIFIVVFVIIGIFYEKYKQ